MTKNIFKNEAVASSRNFVLDSKISVYLDKDIKTKQIFWKLVMDEKIRLKQCFQIRQWTRWLSDSGLALSTRYGNDFQTFKVLDEVVKICIQDIVREFSKKIYDLCIEYFQNSGFRNVHMADMDLCVCTCDEEKKEECQENACTKQLFNNMPRIFGSRWWNTLSEPVKKYQDGLEKKSSQIKHIKIYFLFKLYIKLSRKSRGMKSPRKSANWRIPRIKVVLNHHTEQIMHYFE